MIEVLNQRAVKLKWVGPAPNTNKKFALLIPQFNENNLEKRLEYFKQVAELHKKELDVIIIDDGSTDNSLEKIKFFLKQNPNNFFVASIYPNADKVGALFLTTLAITHELVILSDFDTDIVGLTDAFGTLDNLKKDTDLMGCYFRMVPFEGSGNIFLWQQLEYSLARSLYKFHRRERSIPVMPGAGSCYKREVLNSIYYDHSGLRSGEDREATLIGLKLGYKALYVDTILTLTRPPLSFKSLIKQRIRWNLGYLETFSKEKKYYFSQIMNFSRVGIRTLVDIMVVIFTTLFPIVILLVGISNMYFLLIFFAIFYTVGIMWCLNLLIIAPKESSEFKKMRINSIVFYPIIKILVDYFAWTGALAVFIKKNRAIKKNIGFGQKIN